MGKQFLKLIWHSLFWFQQDQQVLRWINATLSKAVLAHVVGCQSAQEVWLALESRFASLSRSHIIQLKTQLQNIKKGSQSISDYLHRIKHLSDSLAVVSSPVDADDLVLYTLNGLPVEYNSFKTSICTRSSAISIEELHVPLLVEEPNMDGTQSQTTDYTASAFVSSKSTGDGHSNEGSGHGYGRSNNSKGGRNRGGRYFNRAGRGSAFGSSSGRGTAQNTFNRPCCQICNKSGHTALDCFHQMDYSYQGRHPPSQLVAMAASYNPVPYQNWYADSGATNHITNDLGNLSVHNDYISKDKVSVGNGQGLPISSIGSSVVHTKFGLFKLNHILHIPSISTNLLFVHQFAKDNNCIFVFDASGFTIQDWLGKILF
ncbi:hypothetical protein AAC387_Pa04g1633 [Persea americana]